MIIDYPAVGYHEDRQEPGGEDDARKDQRHALWPPDIVKDTLGLLWRDEWLTNLAVHASRDDLAPAVLE